MGNDQETSGLELVGLRIAGVPCRPERVRAALLSAPAFIGCQSVELLLRRSSDAPDMIVTVDHDAGVAVRRTSTVPSQPEATDTRLTCSLVGQGGDVGWLVAHGVSEAATTGRHLAAGYWLADEMTKAPLDPAGTRTANDDAHDRFTDALTGLRNRRFLYDVGPQLLGDAQARGDLAALFLLDLDDFKTVNDTLGHDAGDETLRQVAARLSHVLGAAEVAVRLAGDEFVVLARRLRSSEEADLTAERIAQAFEAPLQWREVSLHIDASMGLALYPRDGDSVETLMRVADDAMYAAKSDGAGLSWHSGASFPSSSQAPVTPDELASALRGHEFLVHYQPQVEASDGRVASFETLVRWQHPVLGLLEPAEFLGLTERSGLMGDLTHTVLRHALQDFSSSLTALAPQATISVNMSARSLLRRGLVDDIVDLLREYDVPPSRLIIEVNEPPARHSRSTLKIFGVLSTVGCQASVHDFGSGQVSLAVLGRYRVIREVKIDPTLVARVRDPSSASMIRAIVSMAHALDLRTVAEGIESEELARTLRSLSCDRLQGFHIAAPMPLPELEAWLATR